MNLSLPPILHFLLIAGAVFYLFLILFMLKKGKLNVQYSIIWLASAAVLLVFAVFPYLIAVAIDIFRLHMTPSSFIFTVVLAFGLLLLLSLSSIVTGFAAKIKQLAQTQALLEKRVRELEDQLAATRPPDGNST